MNIAMTVRSGYLGVRITADTLSALEAELANRGLNTIEIRHSMSLASEEVPMAAEHHDGTVTTTNSSHMTALGYSSAFEYPIQLDLFKELDNATQPTDKR